MIYYIYSQGTTEYNLKGFDIMKRKRKLNVKNCFTALLCIVSVTFGLWLFASWVDVNAHNDYFANDYQDFANWNFFIHFADF